MEATAGFLVTMVGPEELLGLVVEKEGLGKELDDDDCDGDADWDAGLIGARKEKVLVEGPLATDVIFLGSVKANFDDGLGSFEGDGEVVISFAAEGFAEGGETVSEDFFWKELVAGGVGFLGANLGKVG
eukprot:m.195013 g.195013  ORF g.195013 m.195013 type:complete len:129 (-) comp25819_c0_seq3:88-474(-)